MMVEDGRTRQETYWEPKAAKGVTAYKREDAFEAFREILFRAVECRLDRDRPVAALLSGGLDSSSVTAVAARCLEKQNRQLTTISAVVPEEHRARFPDERDYINEFRSWPNIRMEYVTAPGRGPFDSLHDLKRLRGSPTMGATFYLGEELEKAALCNGAESLFGGWGGEWAATAWGNRYYLEMALRFRFVRLLRELRCVRTVRKVSPLRVMGGQVLSCIRSSRLNHTFFLLNRSFCAEYQARRSWESSSPYQTAYQAAMLRHGLSKHALRGQPALSLIRPRIPLLDKRILEFCLAMDPDLNLRDGYQRYLIRRALDGVLPNKLQWRIDKLHYSPDYAIRYDAQVGLAREFVAAIGNSDPVRSIVDVHELARLLKPENPAGATREARELLIPGTIYLINFLRQFSEFQVG
jgi:asparagine synthase (glutamine-hydrolysing)